MLFIRKVFQKSGRKSLYHSNISTHNSLEAVHKVSMQCCLSIAQKLGVQLYIHSTTKD